MGGDYRMSAKCQLLGHDDFGNLVYLVTIRNPLDPDDFVQFLDWEYVY